MKIRVRQRSYEEVLKIPPFPHRDPVKQSPFLRKLVKIVSAGELKQVRFSCSYETPYGTIMVSGKRESDGPVYEIHVPDEITLER